MILSIMTLSIKMLCKMTLDTMFCNAECCVSFIVMPRVDMLNVVILSVVAPQKQPSLFIFMTRLTW